APNLRLHNAKRRTVLHDALHPSTPKRTTSSATARTSRISLSKLIWWHRRTIASSSTVKVEVEKKRSLRKFISAASAQISHSLLSTAVYFRKNWQEASSLVTKRVHLPVR